MFTAGLAVTFGGGAAIGAALGPDRPSRPAPEHGAGTTEPGDESMAEMPGMDSGDASPAGVTSSRGGYTLSLETRELSAGVENELRFVITGSDSQPVTEFEVAHDQQLHLVVVGRDLVGYAHVHPELDPSGPWRATLPTLEPGSYRVYADFVPAGGENVVLGADLAIPGDYAPAEVPAPATEATVDGYTVTIDGELAAGEPSELTLSVAFDSQSVSDLDPYLGALGHLVAIRDGDMAYLHVHPFDDVDGPGGPDVRFAIDVPTDGTYRLFFDFSHAGVVRTAAFTAIVGTDTTGMDPGIATTDIG